VPTRSLTRYAWLSIGVALSTMALKLVAWRITGSVGLLSDALESTVNLAAALLMLFALRLAAQPPDETHHFGHDKAELFSAGAEGLMIVVAAGLIVWTAVGRLLEPRGVEQLGIGLAVSVGASLVNLGAALVLLRAGRYHGSRALVADAHHLMTDVLTSAGVVVGVLLVGLTGWQLLDPLVALAVSAQILFTGGRLVWQSAGGLMDPPLGTAERATIDDVLRGYEASGIAFHAVRSRVAGHRRFLSLHVLVPGNWTVATGHAVVERIEGDLRAAVDHLVVFSHLEPVEDPASYLDEELDRIDARRRPGSDR
jgi:cation diffusion facilitator family transporter